MHYQHLRHLTTLSLTSAGGVITLAGSGFADVEPLTDPWLITGLFLLAALCAHMAAAGLINHLTKGKPIHRSTALAETLAEISLPLGVGWFLAFAVDHLG